MAPRIKRTGGLVLCGLVAYILLNRVTFSHGTGVPSASSKPIPDPSEVNRERSSLRPPETSGGMPQAVISHSKRTVEYLRLEQELRRHMAADEDNCRWLLRPGVVTIEIEFDAAGEPAVDCSSSYASADTCDCIVGELLGMAPDMSLAGTGAYQYTVWAEPGGSWSLRHEMGYRWRELWSSVLDL